MIFLQVAGQLFYPARFLKRFVFACRNSIDFLFPDVGINFWFANFVRDILGLRLLFLVDHLLHLDGCVQFGPDLSPVYLHHKGCP